MSLPAEIRRYLEEHREAAQDLLLTWFRKHARDLPWRHDRTPYRVWVSEVMLQQTQVETVVDYYQRFLQRFPTLAALAAGSQEEVLKLWEGLGYYSRARALHRAAEQVVQDHGGRLPNSVPALEALPGIGPYTAGAIASIAFGIPAPAVDGNVRRVMSRVLAEADPKRRMLAAAVQMWMPSDEPGAFTEALMELGATLCSPRGPHCLLCPWRAFCQGRVLGEPEAFPAPKPRKAIPYYDVAAAVTLRGPRRAEDVEVLVAQRLSDAMLGGLWEFPGGKRDKGESLPEALRRELQEEMAVTIEVGERLTVIKHAYTHFRITLHAFICRLVAGEPRCIACQDFQWADLSKIAALPMPVTDRKIAAALAAWLPDAP
jgi:A/G-specific adenine glycosylase